MSADMVQTRAGSGCWRKILIVGGPGSGKTTLATRLAGVMDIPCHELDVTGYEGGAGPERPLADRVRDVTALARQDDWVAEGSFIGWTDALAEAADLIVWLDVPWRVARRRIVLRHVKASLARSNKHPGWRQLWRFVQNSRGWYVDSSPDGGRGPTIRWLKAFTEKVLVRRTDREVEEFFRSTQLGRTMQPA